MAVCQADLSRDLVKSHGKRKGSQISCSEHNCGDGSHDCDKLWNAVPVPAQKDKKEHGSAYYIIDWKIPEIGPSESAGHKTGHQHLRTNERKFPASVPVMFLRPGINHGRHGYDKQDIDIVGMKISEDGRIGRKLVYRFVRKIRIIPDIARGIGEPVKILLPPETPDRGQDESVQHVVDIPAESNRGAAKQAAENPGQYDCRPSAPAASIICGLSRCRSPVYTAPDACGSGCCRPPAYVIGPPEARCVTVNLYRPQAHVII